MNERTPAATWREEGLKDPHGAQYDCERAKLVMGNLTDDELANGVFLHGDGTHGRAPIAEVVAGRAFWPIAWLTAAKDRIRWLSRALERERAEVARLRTAIEAVAREQHAATEGILALHIISGGSADGVAPSQAPTPPNGGVQEVPRG